MLFEHLFKFLLFAIPFVVQAEGSPRRRCRYEDHCWPSDDVWQKFNQSISGRLVRTLPSAAVCHEDNYNESACHTAKTHWTSSFWRTSQPGAYTGILWELGKEQCFINSSRTDPCSSGRVPHYSINASGVEDIQAAVSFASKKDLYLVIKNTGHDHLGRSSGRGAFSIWTHNLKGRRWHAHFVASGAPHGTKGQPAVMLQAGEQWLDVYRAASERHRIVVGGSARTVGTTGGYLTGGGHSPWANVYGLAVDNVLEIKLVNAEGEHITLNEYTDPEYFWAVRGGGGSAWGVITEVTYRTHPEPSHIQIGLLQLKTTRQASFGKLFTRSLANLVNVTDAGYTGYGIVDTNDSFSAIFIKPNGTNSTFDEAFAGFYQMSHSQADGIVGQVGRFNLPRWIDYCNTFLTDPNIAQNVQDASRLLTKEVALGKADQLLDLMSDFPEYPMAFNFIGKPDQSQRNHTSVHPAWRDARAVMSFGTDWQDTASEAEKSRKRKGLVEVSQRLGEIFGKEGGAYVNEANPYEPKWQDVFWGRNYGKLLRIKREVDPTNLFVCNRCVGTDVLWQA